MQLRKFVIFIASSLTELSDVCNDGRFNKQQYLTKFYLFIQFGLFSYNILLFSSNILMRLRKRVIKTEADQSFAATDYQHIMKAKTTVVQKNNRQNLATSNCKKGAVQRLRGNGDNKGKQKGYNKSKKEGDFKTILRQSIDFKAGITNQQNRQSRQMNMLKYHINGLARKYPHMHKRNFTQPTPRVLPSSSRKQNDIQGEQPLKTRIYSACCMLIDDIYAKIELLRGMGYSDYKINDWVLGFCDSRRPSLKQIFMKNISKSLYTLTEEYEYLKLSCQVKARLCDEMRRHWQKYNYIETDELREFALYLQEILIQKNNLKAREVQEAVVDKLSVDLVPRIHTQFFSFTKKQPVEDNFIHDLAPYEQKYGQFQSLSKIHKLRYLELNKVEKRLKNVYEGLLQSQMRRLVKQSTEKSIGLGVGSPPVV